MDSYSSLQGSKQVGIYANKCETSFLLQIIATVKLQQWLHDGKLVIMVSMATEYFASYTITLSR